MADPHLVPGNRVAMCGGDLGQVADRLHVMHAIRPTDQTRLCPSETGKSPSGPHEDKAGYGARYRRVVGKTYTVFGTSYTFSTVL